MKLKQIAFDDVAAHLRDMTGIGWFYRSETSDDGGATWRVVCECVELRVGQASDFYQDAVMYGEVRWTAVANVINHWNVLGMSEAKANPLRRYRYVAYYPAGNGALVPSVPREATS